MPETPDQYEIILKRIRDIPSLPDVVDRILAIMQRPDVPASEIARLISYDPGLTSKVLRMVNSAAYGFQRQISSIQHSVMILGFTTIRGLVLSASILKLFEGQTQLGGLNHQQFWEHSLGTAMAARLLAQEHNLPEMEDCFSAGMLHDIGKVVLDTYFTPAYHEVLEKARSQRIPCHGLPFWQLEESMMGINHASIGQLLASKWKLPIAITEVIQYHHEPERAENCPRLVYLIALANEMAVLQYEKSGIYDASHFTPALLEYFNMSDEQVIDFLKHLKEDMGSASELLNAIVK